MPAAIPDIDNPTHRLHDRITLVKQSIYDLAALFPQEEIPFPHLINRILLLTQRSIAVAMVMRRKNGTWGVCCPQDETPMRFSTKGEQATAEFGVVAEYDDPHIITFTSVADPDIRACYREELMRALDNQDLSTRLLALPNSPASMLLHLVQPPQPDGACPQITPLGPENIDFQLVRMLINGIQEDFALDEKENRDNLAKSIFNPCNWQPLAPPKAAGTDGEVSNPPSQEAFESVRQVLERWFGHIDERPLLRDINDIEGNKISSFGNILFFVRTAYPVRTTRLNNQLPHGLRLVLLDVQKTNIRDCISPAIEHGTIECSTCKKSDSCPLKGGLPKDPESYERAIDDFIRLLETPFGDGARAIADTALVGGFADFSCKVEGVWRSRAAETADAVDKSRSTALVCLLKLLTGGTSPYQLSCPTWVDGVPFLVCATVTHDEPGMAKPKPRKSWQFNYQFFDLVQSRIAKPLDGALWTAYRAEVYKTVKAAIDSDGDDHDILPSLNKGLLSLGQVFPFRCVELCRSKPEDENALPLNMLDGENFWMVTIPNPFFPSVQNSPHPHLLDTEQPRLWRANQRLHDVVNSVIAEYNSSIEANWPIISEFEFGIDISRVRSNQNLLLMMKAENFGQGRKFHGACRSVALRIHQMSDRNGKEMTTWNCLDSKSLERPDLLEALFGKRRTTTLTLYNAGRNPSVHVWDKNTCGPDSMFASATGSTLLLLGAFRTSLDTQNKLAEMIEANDDYDVRVIFGSSRHKTSLYSAMRSGTVSEKLYSMCGRECCPTPLQCGDELERSSVYLSEICKNLHKN
ncbi:MAG: hypothetical protein HY055_09770 [Magnetospirillum sp.]|nr:hypothetical protein [Magnetospirillum sp.]